MIKETSQPTNSTNIIDKIPDHIMNPESSPRRETDLSDDWDYTVAIKDRHGETYQQRHLIGRDTTIDGGVYYGTYGGEAIVVDTQKYPKSYEVLLNDVIERSKSDGVVKRSNVLQSVFDIVSEKMKYSKDGVSQIVGNLPDGTKIELSNFINSGVGVCRHQALLVGVLLERMKALGHISGDISVDRNKMWKPNGERSGHAWVRYTASNGLVAVLDVAQHKFMLLDDVDSRKDWNYLRPEEQAKIQSKKIGNMAVESA